MTDILMPALTDQMEQGTIVAWLVGEGETVQLDQEIVEIETDKATVAYRTEVEGVLQIVVQVGDTVAVGDLIARVGVTANADRPADPEPEPATPEESEAADPQPQHVPTSAGNSHVAAAEGARATPLARRAAKVHATELSTISGTGPRGRVTKADVLRAAGIEAAPEPPGQVPSPRPATADAPRSPASAVPGTRIHQPTRLQQVVAQRMTEAGTTVPHFQVQTEVDFDAALTMRAQFKKAAGEGDVVPSVNDLIVKACALALPDHPFVNGSFKEGVYELHGYVHVGIAVASDDGLLVATVADANIKSLGQIARDTRSLAEKVRSGTATPQELTGATFTVSNLGMFGMTAITAVINPPQAAILGVGAARATLARNDDGEIVDQQLLTLTLSCDHRILNGADGSRYLYDVKEILENPVRLSL